MAKEYSEQELVRREKLAQLRAKSYPYPNEVRVNASSQDILSCVDEELLKAETERRRLVVAGRILSMRHMGKASFCNLQDREGKIQLYVKRDDVGEETFEAFKTYDLGDIIEASGYAFRTKTSEPSLHVETIRPLVKCLHPLPEKFHGLTDVEVRYRRRYLDLMVNPEVRQTFITRSRILSSIRRFFDGRGFIEVETPTLSTIASGASARPFRTFHNTLDMELFLRIAPELPLKKLVVGGLERVYEIGKMFRNEGISSEHNPEFTMIEFYQAYATYEDLMDLTEELITGLCQEVCGSETLTFDEVAINFKRPWKRLTMRDAIYEIGGVSREFDLDSLEGVHAAAKSLLLHDVPAIQDYGQALYEVFDRYVESKIVDPTFITQHPTSISPLSRPNLLDPRFTDRFELMVAGMEVANAFSELNDPEDQAERFQSQIAQRAAGNDEAMVPDDDFVTALEYGLPPTAGQGIGIDRLVMLLTNSKSIRDVILFPTMRPVENQ